MNVTKLVADYAVGGDAEIAVCALPSGDILVASRTARPMTALTSALQVQLFKTANECAVLAYEALGAHGTNLIVEDAPHAAIRVVARFEDDGQQLSPQGTRAAPGDLQNVAQKISSEAWIIGKQDTAKPSANPIVETARPKPLTPKPVEKKDSDQKPPLETESPVEHPDMRAPGDMSGRDLGDVAQEMQTQVRRGPTEEKDYRIRQLTRRR